LLAQLFARSAQAVFRRVERNRERGGGLAQRVVFELVQRDSGAAAAVPGLDLGVAIFLQDCIDGAGELPGLAYL
jgi:hypothetical protein